MQSHALRELGRRGGKMTLIGQAPHHICRRGTSRSFKANGILHNEYTLCAIELDGPNRRHVGVSRLAVSLLVVEHLAIGEASSHLKHSATFISFEGFCRSDLLGPAAVDDAAAAVESPLEGLSPNTSSQFLSRFAALQKEVRADLKLKVIWMLR